LWIDQLHELQQETRDADEFLTNLTGDFFEDRIFLLTPKGDVIDLPRGSGVLDFAYAIHSDIGTHTKGAHVNNKYVGIKTLLRNHDIVEIQHHDSAHPTGKWLGYVKTTLAKKQIKSYLHKHPENIITRFFKRSD